MAKAGISDPFPSHEAAREAEASVCANAQRRPCLAEVLRIPAQTAAEDEVAVGLERHPSSPPLPKLLEAGLVLHGGSRVCEVRRRLSITWHPAQAVQP